MIQAITTGVAQSVGTQIGQRVKTEKEPLDPGRLEIPQLP
jgi:hypothetical protein